MLKKIWAAMMIAVVALSVTSCSIEKNSVSVTTTTATTHKTTRIYNSFKDILPDFGFDSMPVENYREGISYSFSADCSERDFKKYINAIKKAGFETKAVEADGYYAAYSEDNYYVEITLVSGYITVFIKKT